MGEVEDILADWEDELPPITSNQVRALITAVQILSQRVDAVEARLDVIEGA